MVSCANNTAGLIHNTLVSVTGVKTNEEAYESDGEEVEDVVRWIPEPQLHHEVQGGGQGGHLLGGDVDQCDELKDDPDHDRDLVQHRGEHIGVRQSFKMHYDDVLSIMSSWSKFCEPNMPTIASSTMRRSWPCLSRAVGDMAGQAGLR